jgi:hypothetical protein
MSWLRRLADALRAALTIEKKLKSLRWRRVQHGEEPHVPDR